MIRIEATPDLQTLSKAFRELGQRQLPFAMAKAATSTAKRVQQGLLEVMGQRIENPTRYTMNSVFLSAATKANTQAIVGYKDKGQGVTPDTYMQTPVQGGRRKAKRFDRALQARGLIKGGQTAIPLPDVLDANGNAKGSTVRRILRELAKEGAKAKYFVAEIEGTYGVWERRSTGFGEAIRPVFSIVESMPAYAVQVPFFKIAQNIVQANYQREFTSALEYAIETARK